MKKLLSILVVVAMVALVAPVVFADPGPYSPTMNVDGYDSTPDAVATPNQAGGNPEVYEALNYVLNGFNIPAPSTYTSNEQTDGLQVTGVNSYWTDVSPTGFAGNFAAIGISAGNTNTLGLYLAGSTTVVPAMYGQTGFGWLENLDGSLPGGVNTYNNGEKFGFALTSANGSTNVWYSDPSLNADGIDHMLAFYLPMLDTQSISIDINNDGFSDQTITFTADTYMFAFEDLDLNNAEFDSDYNDTIFLVTRIAPVPEPMTMMLLGSGLLGLVGLRKKVA